MFFFFFSISCLLTDFILVQKHATRSKLICVQSGRRKRAPCTLPCSQTPLFFSKDKSARKGRRDGEKSPLSLSHGPSRCVLVTSRICFALALTSPLLGRSKRLIIYFSGAKHAVQTPEWWKITPSHPL